MSERGFRTTIVGTGCVVAITTWVQLAGFARQTPAPLSRPTDNGFTYFIEDGDPASGYRPSDRELAAWAFAAWERSSVGGLHLEPSREPDALVRLYWASPNGTTYGEMRAFLINGRRGAAVFVRPAITALGPAIASQGSQDPLWRETIVYLTCLHELGHAFGLPHTADDRDIMYSFQYGGDIVEYFSRYRRALKARSDISSHLGLSEADVKTLRTLHPVS